MARQPHVWVRRTPENPPWRLSPHDSQPKRHFQTAYTMQVARSGSWGPAKVAAFRCICWSRLSIPLVGCSSFRAMLDLGARNDMTGSQPVLV
jgi:hypothetical protein